MTLDLLTEARLNQARLYVHAIVDASTVRACGAISDSLYYARRACGITPSPRDGLPLVRIVRDCRYVEAEARKIYYLRHYL